MKNSTKVTVLAGVFVFVGLFAGEAYSKPRHRNEPSRKPARIAKLPSGFKVVKHHKAKYFHHHGIYYKHGPKGYAVCRAPIGLRIRTLPHEHISFRYHGRPYYYYYGTYYIYDEVEKIYIVSEKPEIEDIRAEKSELEILESTSGFDRISLIDGSNVEGIYLGGTADHIYMEVSDDTLKVPVEKVIAISIAPSLEE